ncbi:Hypothetical_protein [Hexamita inflata]|uniref:Hypothetical_protein n=1 Tax=Hexamita inflata TaxID=28002 RepID=A0AA86PFW1_9EUKA|nr:Hypothetical protein HINF_LOCUS25498 [Hexamita inflata]
MDISARFPRDSCRNSTRQGRTSWRILALLWFERQVPCCRDRFADHVRFWQWSYWALYDRDAFVFVIISGVVVALIRLNLRSMLVWVQQRLNLKSRRLSLAL